jgi:hypothetical protein
MRAVETETENYDRCQNRILNEIFPLPLQMQKMRVRIIMCFLRFVTYANGIWFSRNSLGKTKQN